MASALWIDTVFNCLGFASEDRGPVIFDLAPRKNGAQIVQWVTEHIPRDEKVSVGCNIGPGPFTSIKNGIATAQALILWLEQNSRLASSAGISSLELLMETAGNVLQMQQGAAVRDARKNRFYVQEFAFGKACTEPQDQSSSEFEGQSLCCWDQDQEAMALAGSQRALSSAQLATQALTILTSEKHASQRSLQPLWIREPDIDSQEDWRSKLLGWKPEAATL